MMINEPTELQDAYSHLLAEMERVVSTLAARWRGTENPVETEMIVRQYQSVLRCMVELGWRASLDVDAELPDEYMPAEYLKLFE